MITTSIPIKKEKQNNPTCEYKDRKDFLSTRRTVIKPKEELCDFYNDCPLWRKNKCPLN